MQQLQCYRPWSSHIHQTQVIAVRSSELTPVIVFTSARSSFSQSFCIKIPLLPCITSPKYTGLFSHCWYYKDTTHSISFSIYSSSIGYIALSLFRAILSVTFVSSIIRLPFWIYKPTCTHSFKKSRFRTFGSSDHYAKTRRRFIFRICYSRYSEISRYFIAAWLSPQTQ